MIVTVFGPGAAGKGTLVRELLKRDPKLWLSRSWTTRDRREGEAEDAYHFVDEPTFRARAESGGFLEWVELLPGRFYGTPTPDAPPGQDLVFEIDVRGARVVKEAYPEAVAILLLAPSEEVQAQRMRDRGDPADRIRERMELSRQEVVDGRQLADHIVVNDDLDGAVAEVLRILETHRNMTSGED